MFPRVYYKHITDKYVYKSIYCSIPLVARFTSECLIASSKTKNIAFDNSVAIVVLLVVIPKKIVNFVLLNTSRSTSRPLKIFGVRIRKISSVGLGVLSYASPLA